MSDPNDRVIRREVGWIGTDFVELIIDLDLWGCGQQSKYLHSVTVLVNGDDTFSTTAESLVEAQVIFDTLEQRLRDTIPRSAWLMHQGVL